MHSVTDRGKTSLEEDGSTGLEAHPAGGSPNQTHMLPCFMHV